MKVLGKIIFACVFFIAGVLLIHVWNYLIGGWMPDWMRKFLIFDEVKHIFMYEATRHFNIIGMIIVIATRGWYYLILTFISLSYINEQLYNDTLISKSCINAFTTLMAMAMVVYPFIFEFPDYGICYTITYEVAVLLSLIGTLIASTKHEPSSERYAKEHAEEMEKFFQSKEQQDFIKEQLEMIDNLFSED